MIAERLRLIVPQSAASSSDPTWHTHLLIVQILPVMNGGVLAKSFAMIARENDEPRTPRSALDERADGARHVAILLEDGVAVGIAQLRQLDPSYGPVERLEGRAVILEVVGRVCAEKMQHRHARLPRTWQLGDEPIDDHSVERLDDEIGVIVDLVAGQRL